jgi:2-oxoglutarate dehydrogenase E2 component (dihydrolipoamide succinyltransferase)
LRSEMTIEIRVPILGESITEATVGTWFKKAGDVVKVDEPLVELETDKVTVEVPAPASGVMGEIIVGQGATVAVGSLLASLKSGGTPAAPVKTASPPPSPPAPTQPVMAPAAVPQSAMPPSPAARKAIAEAGLSSDDLSGSGRRGQVLKSDVIPATANGQAPKRELPAEKPVTPLQPVAAKPAPAIASVSAPAAPSSVALRDVRLPAAGNDANREERVKMTRLRQTIARRIPPPC